MSTLECIIELLFEHRIDALLAFMPSSLSDASPSAKAALPLPAVAGLAVMVKSPRPRSSTASKIKMKPKGKLHVETTESSTKPPENIYNVNFTFT